MYFNSLQILIDHLIIRNIFVFVLRVVLQQSYKLNKLILDQIFSFKFATTRTKQLKSD
jgi:hypothetical protein